MTNYTLAADPLSFAWSVGGNYRCAAEPLTFSLAMPETGMGRAYTADLGSLTLKLQRLQASTSYFNDKGQPTSQMQLFWQRHCEAIELAFSALRDSVLAIQAAYDAASQAQVAATDANNAVAQVQDTVATAQQLVDDLQAGTLNLPSITVGGKRFAYDAGTDDLVPL